MTAKEKQKDFIANRLKPLLKIFGYTTAGTTWWKFQPPFFNLIKLQNFSWNSFDEIDFTFNFTTGFISDIKDLKKVTLWDGFSFARENSFGLSESKYWSENGNGFHIDSLTELDDFSKCVIKDFENLILPTLDNLNSDENIENFYRDDFWGPRVKVSLRQKNKNNKS